MADHIQNNAQSYIVIHEGISHPPRQTLKIALPSLDGMSVKCQALKSRLDLSWKAAQKAAQRHGAVVAT